NLFFFLFFFSSRRRHTSFSRDWSSDVCSSDLPYSPKRSCTVITRQYQASSAISARISDSSRRMVVVLNWLVRCVSWLTRGTWWRSEERRVGKEDSCMWPV